MLSVHAWTLAAPATTSSSLQTRLWLCGAVSTQLLAGVAGSEPPMSVPRGHPGAGKHPRDNDRHRNASVFAAGLRKFDPVSNSCCGRVRNALGALANGEGVGVRSSTRCQPRGPFPSPTEVRELTPPPVSPLCPPHRKDPLGRPRKGRGALREAAGLPGTPHPPRGRASGYLRLVGLLCLSAFS